MKFHTYEATIRFDERLVGGIPVIPEGEDRADAYEKWARGQDVSPGAATELGERLADDVDMPTTADEIAGLITGFRKDEDGLYIEARQIKAMLKETGQRLGFIKNVRGLRQVLQHDLHVRATDGTQKIHLDRSEPDGTDIRPISVVTRQGPRTALKRFDYVREAELTFTIMVLADGIGDGLLTEEKLRDMLELGGMVGLGADRSQGEGCYQLVSLTAQTGVTS